MKKRALTIAEVAEALQITKRSAERRAEADAWPFTTVSVRGGYRRLYPIHELPRAIQDRLLAAEIERVRASLPAADAPADTSPEADSRPVATGPKATARRDAKLTLFEAHEALRATYGLSDRECRAKFAALYAGAALDVRAGRAPGGPEPIASLPTWVFEAVPKLSSGTLRRIVDTVRAGHVKALAGRYANRRDTGVLDVALDPRGKIAGPASISAGILAILTDRPHLSGRALRDQIIGQFGAELLLPTGEMVPVPSVRTIQAYAAKLKARNESLILAITNPDAWRSRYEFAFGEQDLGEGLNDLWQIDASPADVLLLDGRYSVYVLTDLWSRRIMVLVTKTPRAAAVIALVRRALLAWGVPATIKTDNGSDFVAKATRGVLKSLRIEHPRSPKFTPTDKGHVERAIGTLQHDFMVRQPGFIGHNVAQRAAIEARRTFAARVGDADEKAAMCVELDAPELQRRLDRWCEDEYAHRPHEGLGGRTPWDVERSWTGAIRRVGDPRALDLLLWDIPSNNGWRTVGKKGIRVESATFWGPGLVEGQVVKVRLDPGDLGRIYVYTAEDDAFICVAEAPERLGIDRAELAARAKAEQRARVAEARAALKRARRTLRPAQEVAEQVAKMRLPDVLPFPRPTIAHETPALAAAAEAAGSAPKQTAAPATLAEPRAPAPVITLNRRPESAQERAQREAGERFARWRAIDDDLKAGRPVTDSDRRWHGHYSDDSECRAALRAEALVARGVLHRAPA